MAPGLFLLVIIVKITREIPVGNVELGLHVVSAQQILLLSLFSSFPTFVLVV